MFVEAIVVVWTLLGLGWWVASFVLVRTAGPGLPPGAAEPLDPRRITVFKPLPRLSDGELERLLPGLESFVTALDADSEMIVGCHHEDESRVRPLVESMRRRRPSADLKLVVETDPNGYANPKVSWIRILSEHATGELWLWSDADIEIPPHALRSLRADLVRTRAGLLTSPYVVKRTERVAEMLDALFVNLEFYPGALLLGRLDLVRFGFGSGMLFEAADFRRRIDWEFLGSCLAEDFHLGRRLAPARLGSTRFVTTSSSTGWRAALIHYLRWQKTIRWCRPGSYAAQLAVLPILGWQALVVTGPTRPFGWLGLLTVLLADALAAVAVCRAVGCTLSTSRVVAIPVWSLVRGLSWIVCWLPWPIVWRGSRWLSPFKQAFRPGRDGSLDRPGPVRLD